MDFQAIASQLPAIKDWVAVLTGILGGVLGIAGFVLGLMGYIRSGRVERRTYLEPYFRSIWPELRTPIRTHMQGINGLQRRLRESVRADYKHWKNYNFSSWPQAGDRFGLCRFDWSYDKSLRSQIATYVRRCEKLEALVRDFNKLVFLITDLAGTWAIAAEVSEAFRAGNASRSSALEDTLTEGFKADLRAVAEKYVGGVEEIPRLRKSRRYRFDLWLLQMRIRACASGVQRAHSKLSSFIEFYDRRFPSIQP